MSHLVNLYGKDLANSILRNCKVSSRIDGPPMEPVEYLHRTFMCMRRLYMSSFYSHIHAPLSMSFDVDCMEEALLQINAAETPLAVGTTAHWLAVCKKFNHFKANNLIKKSDGEKVDLMKQLRADIEPVITHAAGTLLSEFTMFVSTLKFTTKGSMESFLNEFEEEMENTPFLYGIKWPKNIFASFRVDFLKRDDFKKKFPCKYAVADSKGSAQNPRFITNFAFECLVGITVLDDSDAMEKWLVLATNWMDAEETNTTIFVALDHCLHNNAHKCIKCLTLEVVVQYHGAEYIEDNHNGPFTYSNMFNDWCLARTVVSTRAFGYIGPARWNQMTVKMFDAIYKHKLAKPSQMEQPPRTCALRSRWVRFVRWNKVRSLVVARGFIVQLMRNVADRECHAEFSEDGSASLLGATAREGRALNASLLGGDDVGARIDERACVVRGAPLEFNAMIQSSLDMVQKARLRRLAKESGGSGGSGELGGSAKGDEDEEEDEEEEEEEEERSVKRRKIVIEEE